MAFHDNLNLGTTANDGTGDGLRTNLGKLQDNTKDNKQRIDDLNGNTPGVVSANGVTLLNPLDATASFSATKTGAIKIALPNSWSFTMLKFDVDIYDLKMNKSFLVKVSGYSYTSTPKWDTTSVQIIATESNRNLPVRFGHDGSKCCLYIGELNASWDYPKIAVKNLLLSHQNNDSASWLTGWNIDFEASIFQNVSQTHTNNLPVAQ